MKGDTSPEDVSGMEYLRNLKRQESAASEPVLATNPAPVASQSGIQERRRSIRYKCQGSVEFRVEGSDVRTWGTLTDVSQHGCYVEMMATSPVGSMVNIVLDLNEVRARMKGEVRVSYPCLGMGIAFTEVSPEEQINLHQLLRSLFDSSSKIAPALAEKVTTPACGSDTQVPVAVISDPAAALHAIANFFRDQTVLSRNDFLELIRKSQSGK